MVRKFFNQENGEGGGGETPSIVVGKSFSLGEMAQPEPVVEETKTDTTEGEETKAEEKPAETKPAEGAESKDNKGEQSGAKAEGESKKPDGEQKQELSLQEVLKGKDKREVLRELGVSEEVFDALESATTLEGLKAFLDLRTRNYDSMTDEQVLRENLRKQYPDMEDAKFEKVFKKEMTKYTQDSWDEEEKELGQILLENDATKARASLKNEQAQFKLPQPKPSDEAQKLAALLDAQKEQKEKYDGFVETITNDPVTKALMQDKRIVLAEGTNFEVADPSELLNSVVDTTQLFKHCIKDGKIDLHAVYDIVNYAHNREKVKATMIEAGKTKANLESLDEHVNPSKREAPAAGAQEENLGTAFANRGVHTTMGAVLG